MLRRAREEKESRMRDSSTELKGDAVQGGGFVGGRWGSFSGAEEGLVGKRGTLLSGGG